MRVRFAPSPTGLLHIGSARTALYNWLLARGPAVRGEAEPWTLVLRIEDTDRERSTPENVAQILDALRWLKLAWDEGPVMQTDRDARHREAIAQLIADGHAYYSTATGDDVKAYKAQHGNDRGYRGNMDPAHPNPARPADPAHPAAVRLRVPDTGETAYVDAVRGPISFPNASMDDPVIARADGSVLYNFAVAVDDLDAGIDIVLRGDDHISNTPKQLLVIAALGATPPTYAHMPMILGPDGKKLSKRHGAASVQELRDAGFLPEAVDNYVALLGAGFGSDEEIFSLDELARRFALDRVSRNPAVFDEKKLRHINGIYIRELGIDELTRRLEEFTGRTGLRGAVEISAEKIQTLADFWPLAGFLFDGPADDPKAVAKVFGRDGAWDLLQAARDLLAGVQPFDVEAIDAALRGLVVQRGCKPGEVFQPVRVGIAGTTVSPGIFESVALLGRDETLRRLDAALASR